MYVRRRRVELDRVSIVDGDPQLAGVEVRAPDRSAGPEHVERVLTVADRMRDRDARARTAVELQQHGGGVLDVAIEDVVRGQRLSASNRAEQVHEHLE